MSDAKEEAEVDDKPTIEFRRICGSRPFDRDFVPFAAAFIRFVAAGNIV